MDNPYEAPETNSGIADRAHVGIQNRQQVRAGRILACLAFALSIVLSGLIWVTGPDSTIDLGEGKWIVVQIFFVTLIAFPILAYLGIRNIVKGMGKPRLWSLLSLLLLLVIPINLLVTPIWIIVAGIYLNRTS